MHRALFVCSQNRLRSPTAEAVFSGYAGVLCASAGTDDQADTPLDAELIQWADGIYVMEARHKVRISKQFAKHLAGKRIFVLNIPDDFDYMAPELIVLLERKLGPTLRRFATRG